MNSLTKEQKNEVAEEIKSILRKKNIEIIDEVEQKFSYANRNQISGILSGLDKNNVIGCADGYCYMK